MDTPTYTCRKNGKAYSEAAIARHLSTEIHNHQLTDDQCRKQLYDQFGFSEELIERITRAAKALPRPAAAPAALPTSAAPQPVPVASIADISMSLTPEECDPQWQWRLSSRQYHRIHPGASLHSLQQPSRLQSSGDFHAAGVGQNQG